MAEGGGPNRASALALVIILFLTLLGVPEGFIIALLTKKEKELD